MIALEAVFWAALGALVWTHAAYPLAAAGAARIRRRPVRGGDATPSVSVIVAAYNEEAVIGRRLENLLALDYPADRLDVVVVSDASHDRTDELVLAAAAREPAEARRLFAEAVDVLAALQEAGARDPDPACPAFSRRFDAALAAAEIEHFVDHGIETRHGIRLPADVRAAILEAFAPCVAPFASGPTDLSHRDYMAWNLHRPRSNRRV